MNIADSILQNQDRDGMLRRSLERIIQLYTDKSHFIYELLQNAEDAGATGIRFVQYSDRLEVMHDGKSFTTENLQGLCDIGQSDKINNYNQIGEFGVGFKSVFGICDIVRLYSSPREEELADNCFPFAVEIQEFTKPVDIPTVDIPSDYTTLFVFPYSVGSQFSGFNNMADLQENITARLKNLGITTLLFMRSLKRIQYEILILGEESSGEYMLATEQINDHCNRVSAIDSNDDKLGESVSFIKFSMPIDQRVSTRTIDIAFTIATGKDGKTSFQKLEKPFISVYFPTETESKLNFIVQGPFRTTPNRSSVPTSDKENRALAEQMAKLFRRSILELRDMKLLDLSLISILPINKDVFDINPLFYPLYKEMLILCLKEDVLPVNGGGRYTCASRALIARNKDIAELLPCDLISELINDEKHYEWLPVSLTESGPFHDVYSYCTSTLKIVVIRPDDLKSYFNANHRFLPSRDNEWLVRLYQLFETVPNIFSEKNSRNILDAEIVRTASNRIVAPYRKSQSSYVPNVFLPLITTVRINKEFVHPDLYNKCRSFFENVLHLKQPNEYEYFVNSLEERYSNAHFYGTFYEHILDIRTLVKYIKQADHKEELQQFVKHSFLIKCRSAKNEYWIRPFSKVIRFPKSETGLMLEQYFKGVEPDAYFVCFDEYQSAGITFDDLRELGVTDKIIINDNLTKGEYYTGARGRQPEWRTDDDFRWKLGIDKLEEALIYICQHPEAKDALIKSQVIFKTLQENVTRLVGTVHFSGAKNPDKYNEHAAVIHSLNQDGNNLKLCAWNGKWLYTESGELVSHKAISKHDLNKALYGKVRLDSNLYDILGFKKGEIDHYEDIVKDYDTLTEEKKRSYFEIELERRHHITPEQLLAKLEGGFMQGGSTGYSEEEEFKFPSVPVMSWDALKKHAAQILYFASPTQYETVVRRIRVSRQGDAARTYLAGMYRINSSKFFACQLCHKPSQRFEACQLEQKPDMELDPLYLCLCPNCAARFQIFRNNKYQAEQLLDSILDVSEDSIDNFDHISVNIDDYDFWFTPTHIAEIIELMKLKRKAKEEPNASSNAMGHPPLVVEKDKVELQRVANADDFVVGKRVLHNKQNEFARVVERTGGKVVLEYESGCKVGQRVTYNLEKSLAVGLFKVIEEHK